MTNDTVKNYISIVFCDPHQLTPGVLVLWATFFDAVAQAVVVYAGDAVNAAQEPHFGGVCRGFDAQVFGGAQLGEHGFSADAAASPAYF